MVKEMKTLLSNLVTEYQKLNPNVIIDSDSDDDSPKEETPQKVLRETSNKVKKKRRNARVGFEHLGLLVFGGKCVI